MAGFEPSTEAVKITLSLNARWGAPIGAGLFVAEFLRRRTEDGVMNLFGLEIDLFYVVGLMLLLLAVWVGAIFERRWDQQAAKRQRELDRQAADRRAELDRQSVARTAEADRQEAERLQKLERDRQTLRGLAPELDAIKRSYVDPGSTSRQEWVLRQLDMQGRLEQLGTYFFSGSAHDIARNAVKMWAMAKDGHLEKARRAFPEGWSGAHRTESTAAEED